MKRISFLLIVSVIGIIMFISSCKKDTVAPTVVGFWKGKTSSDPLTPPDLSYYFILIKSNGHVTEWYDAVDTFTTVRADSTYILNGNDISWTVRYGGAGYYDYKETLSSDGNTLTGTWGYTPSHNDGGQVSVTRQ